MSGSLVQQKLPPGVAWVKANIKTIPKNAYVGGWEDGGKRHVYIGRAEHNGSLITGKTIPFWGGMFFPLGREVKNTSFEVLVADNSSLLRWVPASGNQVPNGAIQGGYQGGDPLYLARGRNPKGEPTPGKLHPPHGFFLSWGGGEHHPHEYEVLVCDNISAAQQSKAPAPEPQPVSARSQITQQLPRGAAWVRTDIHNIPKNAFVGGWEDGGKRHVFVGRADYNGMLITGKAIPFWGGMFFPLNGHEVKNTSFEVLVTDKPSMFKWVAAAGNQVPNGAIQGGYQGGDPLYLARGRNPKGEPTPGKLHPPHGFFLPWDGGEHHPHKYEVLVCDNISAAQQSKAPAPEPQPVSARSQITQQLPRGAAWVRTDIHNIPKNAFVGGWEDGGKSHVFVGRADYNGMLITGKAIPFWGGMFFPLNGHEVKNTSFEVLVTDNPSMFKWVAAAGNQVPNGAIHGGYQGGDPLYLARGRNPKGEPTPGKLHPPHGFFLSWDGGEHHPHEYEVLVCDNISAAQQSKAPAPEPQPVSARSQITQQLPRGAAWVRTDIHNIPKNAFVGGWEDGGISHVFVGRADYNGMLITGKAIPFWGGMFFPLNGHEVKNTSFEVLVTDNPSMFKWVAAAGNSVPKGAVQGGFQGTDPIYVARGINPAGEPTPGKLHPPYGFFLSWDGREHHRKDYEVLTCDGILTVVNVTNEKASSAPKVGEEPNHPRKQSLLNTASQMESSMRHQDPVHWVPTTGNEIPKNAVVGGKVKSTDLYIEEKDQPPPYPGLSTNISTSGNQLLTAERRLSYLDLSTGNLAMTMTTRSSSTALLETSPRTIEDSHYALRLQLSHVAQCLKDVQAFTINRLDNIESLLAALHSKVESIENSVRTSKEDIVQLTTGKINKQDQTTQTESAISHQIMS